MIQVVDMVPGTAAWARWMAPLIAAPPAELWTDGAHDLDALPAGIVVWAAVDGGDRVLALAAAWPGDGDTWWCGLNAELGWRDRYERHWPAAHAARQSWLVQQRLTARTWLHDDPPPAPAGSADVVRVHLQTGWRIVTERTPSPDGRHWACQLAWP